MRTSGGAETAATSTRCRWCARDTIIVSKRNGTQEVGADGVQIIGEVRSPSIYALEDVTDMVGMLLLAGGPMETSKLDKVRLVRTDASGATTSREFNVQSYLERGVASQNPECQAGDTIYVPRKLGTVGRFLRNISIGLGIAASTLELEHVAGAIPVARIGSLDLDTAWRNICRCGRVLLSRTRQCATWLLRGGVACHAAEPVNRFETPGAGNY